MKLACHALPDRFPCTGASRRPGRLALAVLFLLTAWTSMAAQAAAPWPTNRFEVFGGNPVIGGNQILDAAGIELPEFEDQLFPLDTEVRAEIERAFMEAATWYQAKGFPAPALELNEAGTAYRVYVCSDEIDQAVWEGVWGFLVGADNAAVAAPYSRCGYDPLTEETKAGLYLPQCGDDTRRSRIMIVNSDKSLDEAGQLTELGYQTIAHELMHAIVANTEFARSDPDCKVGGWISEGLADAISYDIAETLWQSRYLPGMSSAAVIKRDGYRPYLESLPQTGNVPIPVGGQVTATYTSSSFWRYLADAHLEGWGILVTADKPNAPLGFLDMGWSVSRGQDGEVNWLDDGLQINFARNLADLYARFVNDIPFLIPPMKSFQGKPAEENFVPWVNLLFGECAKVDLTASRFQTITLDLKPLASRCIWVEPTYAAGLIQVSFQAMSDDETLLKAITIGRSGTGLLARAVPIGKLFYEQQYLASWRDFPQDGGLRTLYVVSNVAAQPATTVPRTITLTVSRPDHLNSALATVPLPASRVAQPPVKPAFRKHARRLSKQDSDTQKMVNEQMQLDKESLNPNVSNATTLRRHPDSPPCTEPFKYQACGPQMQITLSLMPGTYIVPGSTNAQGGIAAQTFGGLIAMSQTSLFDTQERVEELVARIDAIDGSQVNIAVPVFDYGQTPSFDNAHISVDMSGGRKWRAIGPPDERGWTRLRGRVTITEFTPFILSGSFSAPLAEFVESADSESPAVYTPRDTVTGTFTSVAPWLADERVEFLPESTEQMADDIARTLGLPADMINTMKRDGTMPGSPGAAPGGSSGGGTLTPECTCECSMKPFADDLCALLCEEEFAACEND